MELFTLAAQNLMTPMILCFALGLAAALARSDWTVPEAMAKAMSLYLLFAIGFKGGVSVAPLTSPSPELDTFEYVEIVGGITPEELKARQESFDKHICELLLSRYYAEKKNGKI
jgi:hypothetical protein